MRALKRDLARLTIDVPYKLKFFNEETEQFTEYVEGHIIYLDMFVNGKLFENIYIAIEDSYPLKPPVVYLGEYINHPNVIDEDGQICFGDWSPTITLNQILWHIYLILCEK